MAKGSISRSAITGRFVSRAAAARWPSRTVTEANGGRNAGGGTAYRSASSGRYVTQGTARRNPSGTVRENG